MKKLEVVDFELINVDKLKLSTFLLSIIVIDTEEKTKKRAIRNNFLKARINLVFLLCVLMLTNHVVFVKISYGN